ncbi:transmembrane protein [Thalictrum thalictroides]|uniref:Transmembrane protein n=1 Tax=Thalictrum thalictroides TaxID=46969 RepID=A0A7J6V5X9_THATH|nr:transmembrane protein [Thalictrum thalictroides]
MTDSEMQEQIEKSLYSGQASYEVSLAARFLDIWEPAILAVKREGYSIKCIGTRGVVVTEKFLQKTAVTIPYGHPTAFSILGSAEQLLRTENSSLRDTIVLTMRLFIMRAVEKRKAKKKGIFFNK